MKTKLLSTALLSSLAATGAQAELAELALDSTENVAATMNVCADMVAAHDFDADDADVGVN
jgi:hypothetical protein